MKKEKNKELILIGLITLCNYHYEKVKECEEAICKEAGVKADTTSGEYWLDGIWGGVKNVRGYAKDLLKYKKG